MDKAREFQAGDVDMLCWYPNPSTMESTPSLQFLECIQVEKERGGGIGVWITFLVN